MSARARERGAVLVLLGPTGGWQEGPDVVLRIDRTRWEGLGDGHGRLRARRVRVEATGRRRAARPRTADLDLPAPPPTPAAALPTLRSGAEQRVEPDADGEAVPTEEGPI